VNDRIDPAGLLADLIRCPSVTPETAGVLDIIEQALRPLGFDITRLRFEGDGSYPVDNLFATRRRAGRHLLFNGHTDVVPPGDAALWTHPPFSAHVENGLIFGRGAADMKSGVAAFIAAAARAVASGAADQGTLSIAITNDEEADSINGTEKLMAWAHAQGHRFDFAIVGEPSATTRVGDSIKLGRRGSFNGQISLAGVQGHVAYPDRAKNPLPAAAALMTALSGPLDQGTAFFPASNLEFTSADVGNTTTNVIPAQVLLRFNVRYNDGFSPESLKADLERRMALVDLQGCTARLSVVGRPSRSFVSPLGGGVERLIATITAETGSAPELSTAGGTSDARFIAPFCPVVEFGLPGSTLHQANEHVRLVDVEALCALYARFIGDYFG
jgi:succinyl-diaminopimelate desuccinylase